MTKAGCLLTGLASQEARATEPPKVKERPLHLSYPSAQNLLTAPSIPKGHSFAAYSQPASSYMPFAYVAGESRVYNFRS